MNKETQKLKKTIRKSEVQAQTPYDYKKMEYRNEKFLGCTIEEKEEILEITYEMNDCHPFSDIRVRTMQERLRILIDIAGLNDVRQEYSFSMKPDNLYFDENYRVYVMDRDVYQRGEGQLEDFSEEYKALIGYSLQKKYSYDDYKEGGMELLGKNKFLKEILPLQSIEEIVELLKKEYQKLSKEIREKKLLVNKKIYIGSRVYMILSILLLIAGLTIIIYYSFFDRPRLEAKLKAEADFIRGDYIQVIDDLEDLSMRYLSYDQKYILSVAFVNTESLTVEQKTNILETLPVNGDEKLMEYWIYIGRLNPLEAENIAMQKSDDELLLYAYMLEKDLTETDTEITGEEKAAKLEELENKIEKLAAKYTVEEEQN